MSTNRRESYNKWKGVERRRRKRIISVNSFYGLIEKWNNSVMILSDGEVQSVQDGAFSRALFPLWKS